MTIIIILTILIPVHLGLNAKVIKIVNILQNSCHSLQSNGYFFKKAIEPQIAFLFCLFPRTLILAYFSQK